MEYEPYNPYKQNPCLNGNRPEIKPEINIKDIHDRIEDIKQTTDNEINEFINFSHSSSFFKKIFKTIGCISNETKISFTKDKIKTVVVDPAHIMMLTLEIPNTAIEEYYIKKDMSLGLDIDKLNYLLKTSKKTDMFKFVYDAKKDINKSFINIGLFKHSQTLIDSENLPNPKIPNILLPVKIKLDINILYDFLIQADNISDHIEITAEKNELTLHAENDTDNVTITLTRDHFISYQCDSRYKSLFSVDYMLNIIKQLKTLFTDIELKIGNDNPIEINCDNGYTVKVLLAPRIESE